DRVLAGELRRLQVHQQRRLLRGVPEPARRGRRPGAGGRVRRGRADLRTAAGVPARRRRRRQRGARMMTSAHALRAGFALPGRPASRGRRRVLGLLGALPALAALGACTPWGGGSGGDLTASACAEGATVPRPSTSWGEDSGDREIVVDDSVLSREAIAVSPDGALVAANTGIGLKRKGEAETAGTTLWNTTDGSLLALGGPERIEITAVEGEVLWTLTGHTPPREGGRGRGVQDLAFSADGSTLVSLGADGTVRLWTGLGAACSPGEILDVRDLE